MIYFEAKNMARVHFFAFK